MQSHTAPVPCMSIISSESSRSVERRAGPLTSSPRGDDTRPTLAITQSGPSHVPLADVAEITLRLVDGCVVATSTRLHPAVQKEQSATPTRHGAVEWEVSYCSTPRDHDNSFIDR